MQINAASASRLRAAVNEEPTTPMGARTGENMKVIRLFPHAERKATLYQRLVHISDGLIQ